MIYTCPVCRHMPTEHGPDGCAAQVTYAGGPEITRQLCGCRAMLNGELVSTVAAEGGPVARSEADRPSSPPTQGGQPVAFDIENFSPGQRMEGQIARKEMKAQLWVNKLPFEVSAPPQRRSKPTQFMVARQDGTMPPPDQWWVPIRVLQYRSDGSDSFAYRMQADGEGGQEVEEHILTFDCGSDWRDQQMNALAQYVQEAGRAGPFRLDQGQSSGRGAAPWVLKNWKAEDAGFPPVRAAAPTSVAASPSAAASTPPAAPAPPPVPQAPPPAPTPPPPPADPYTYATRYDGVQIRWKDGMADWEPVPAVGPPVVQAQPLASVRTVVGINPGDRMEGAARTVVEQADGTQIRQATYHGDGVIVTPQGVPTQVASGSEPRSRQEAISGNRGPETAVAVPAALGIEEPLSVAPGPAPAPTAASQQSVIRAAYDNRSVVLVTLLCDHPDHTDTGPNGPTPARVSMQAFYDPTADMWKQTHNCPGSKKVRVLDATAAVKAAAGVA